MVHLVKAHDRCTPKGDTSTYSRATTSLIPFLRKIRTTRDAPVFLCRNTKRKQPAAAIRPITASFDRGRRSFEFCVGGPLHERLSSSLVFLPNRRFVSRRSFELHRPGILRVFPSSSGPFSSASRPPRCDATRWLR
jgi:hypothetical protein